MASFNAEQLYQWMTEEMSILPYNKSSKDKIPLTVDDLEFLVQGPGKEVWNHIGTHVFSRKKVDKIRKNILLIRLRAMEADGVISKDFVGQQLKSLMELRDKRSAIDKGRLLIAKIKEKSKQVTPKLKVIECKRQFLKSQSNDTERHILLLQLAEDSILSKVQLCKSSEHFFDRFKSEKSKDVDSSHKTDFMRSNESHSTSTFLFCENNEDSDLRSQAGCLKFIDKCTAATKEMVEEKCSHMFIDRPSASVIFDSFSSMQLSCMTSTPVHNRVCAAPKFETKKKELRKYLSEKMLQQQPQLLQELLLRQTSKGIASLAGCLSEDSFKDKLCLSGTRNAQTLKAELNQKFSDLYVAINHNMISCARERNIASKAEQDLSSLMAQVEKELKGIFTIQATMVEKVYELVKLEAEIASISGATAHMEEFIRGQDLDLSKHSTGLKELNMPDEAKLLKSLEVLKKFREGIRKKILGNHSSFHKVINEMRDPDFLRELGSFFIEGLISQEIASFTDYPLEYHAKTNVYGKLIPDFKLLNNGSYWQNLVCLGVNGSDETIFELCMKATMGLLPHCSPETILKEAFKSKLYSLETDAVKLLGMDGLAMGSAHLIFDPQILHKVTPLEFHEKEGQLEAEIRLSNEIAKSHNKETSKNLDEAEFLLSNWSKSGIDKCIPRSILYNGKTFQEWNLEYLSALYTLKKT